MRPVLVFDDDCGICTRSAEFLARHDGFDLVGFSELTPEQRNRLPEDWEDCAHFLTDEAVYSCGEAMDEAFARTRLVPYGLVRSLRRVPGYRPVRNRVYRFIADHRPEIGRMIGR